MEQYILTIATGVLGFLGYTLRRWVEVNLKPKQLDAIATFAQRAVLAAEQYGLKLNIPGGEKYALAKMALVKGARRFGLKLTDEEAHTLIHSALYELQPLFKSEHVQSFEDESEVLF